MSFKNDLNNLIVRPLFRGPRVEEARLISILEDFDERLNNLEGEAHRHEPMFVVEREEGWCPSHKDTVIERSSDAALGVGDGGRGSTYHCGYQRKAGFSVVEALAKVMNHLGLEYVRESKTDATIKKKSKRGGGTVGSEE